MCGPVGRSLGVARLDLPAGLGPTAVLLTRRGERGPGGGAGGGEGVSLKKGWKGPVLKQEDRYLYMLPCSLTFQPFIFVLSYKLQNMPTKWSCGQRDRGGATKGGEGTQR